jgi:hypothetical protein
LVKEVGAGEVIYKKRIAGKLSGQFTHESKPAREEVKDQKI